MPSTRGEAKPAKSPTLPVPKLNRGSVAYLRAKAYAPVGGHVEAVGQQRHRAEDGACDDLADHHDCGQCHHPQGATRIIVVGGAQKIVVVGVEMRVSGRHGRTYRE
jgi:hypothetical protein